MGAVVQFALKRRWLVLLFLVIMLGTGGFAFSRLNIEAYPDPVPPLVDIITQYPGQSAEEIERNITIPIEIQLAGIPHVKTVRTISLFGLSDVKVQFTYDYSYEEAEQRVINKLSQLSPLPGGVQPQLSPESPIGEIYRYRVVGPPGYSVTDLKTIEDWMLERRFKAVPGVIDVSGWGGKTKTYDVALDKQALMANGLTLGQVLQALNNANINVGGQTIDLGPKAAIVRGVGLIQSPDQIRNTFLKTVNGAPVFVRDVAKVEVGHLPRLGIAGQDQDNDIVEGIVLMHRGEKSSPTIAAVEAEVQKINNSNILPPGVHIERIYDRSQLIDLTTHTVMHNLLFGVILIFLIQWIFLGNLRSAIVVAATIPFALFTAVMILVARGESANLLSVGAIDFGLIVDATVIMVENIFRHLSEAPNVKLRKDKLMARKIAVIAEASGEVNRAIFFSAAIIIMSFLPLFTLTGIEGHIFGPMARTYAYAIAGGLVATFTVSPALSAILLGLDLEERETAIVRWLHSVYHPLLHLALRARAITLTIAGALFLLAIVAAHGLGLEFLPHLEEGNLWIRATMPQSVSLAAGDDYVNHMRRILASYPEVATVISQHGRPDDGTDATGFFNTEFFVPLKPRSEWPSGMTKETLTDDMNRKLAASFAGVDFNFSQYIEDNVEEAASGVKGENSVKLYGNDLESLQRTAEAVKAAMAKVPGITDLSIFNSLGQPTVRIDVDREKAARYGLAPGDVNAVVQAAIGGQAAGNLYEKGSDRNFPIMVRLNTAQRATLDDLRAIPIGVSNAAGGTTQVPLADVATVKLISGPSFIYREQQTRYIPIKFSVRGRDLGGAVADAQKAVATQVKLGDGQHLEWVGEFGDLQAALDRLEVIVPITLVLIGLLLFLHFSSITETLLVSSVLPMTVIGGIFALALTGTPFSVSAAIGFIALFGIAAMEGVIVLSYFHELVGRGIERSEALVQAAETRLRPVLMTCLAACLGLLPAAMSTAIGAQVQRPLALVVVGGILLAPALILLVLPVLIEMFSPAGRSDPFLEDDDAEEAN
ncbi:efflux RND transporter permease subunit [Sphingomonas sanguinis]|jgi:cobalt-zinc-cadmium resistance protein CzcA|uniref:Efflux RND transporter permease subunit n=1 Tax=Sphingomonas sanguinis TaxID=33051 RepID=A0A7Y7QTD0_9SPHN|nr:CusA/CzcA family heavy metal efflux RND transporter [Sphingomonas sanguinis]MBZ6380994.1 CusA/CzcA family heavy metal efflux RND transporter [Sphingomonas sanguinis]NNG49254.1 efflux RND transporter permease subunit [Sphingomonas sanguinis]NNG55353.1 efflux RND transporter permease subunit [Sphingomonas sanguinis]NVP30295.1 efflux RND transporter permease subunit [Sphingomonas sanguinis]